MMTSRTIGNQEKKVKQSTAPIRKPQAAVLRLALASSRNRAGGAGAASRASRGARLVATSAMSISSQGPGWGAEGGGVRWVAVRAGRGAGGGGRRPPRVPYGVL